MRRSIQLRERRLPSNTLCLTIYSKWRDPHQVQYLIHEPAVHNAHLHVASAAAEHQYNFHTYLGRARTPALFLSQGSK